MSVMGTASRRRIEHTIAVNNKKIRARAAQNNTSTSRAAIQGKPANRWVVSDQPVESAGGLHHTRPPAEQKRAPIGGRAVHSRQHRNRGDPRGGGPVERRAGEKPEAARDSGQSEAAMKAGGELGYAHYIIVRSDCRSSRRVRILRYSAA